MKSSKLDRVEQVSQILFKTIIIEVKNIAMGKKIKLNSTETKKWSFLEHWDELIKKYWGTLGSRENGQCICQLLFIEWS